MRQFPLAVLAVALTFTWACGGDDDGGSGYDGGMTQNDAGPPADAGPPPDLALETVATGLDQPLLVTSPPGDDRLFVVEKAGIIKIIENGSVLPTPFIDISDLVTFSSAPNEQGLLGLTFHPDYADNGRFFVFYIAQESVEGPNAHVIAEYQVSGDPNVASTTEDRILVVADDRSNHNGGMIDFGPDGYLYIGLGDGGGSNDPDGNGQETATLLGNILRIDVDNGDPYAIPEDNPFAMSPGDEQKEIWHWGLRNPWRWSFDQQTGDMYIGDVGQNAVEEVDFIPAGVGGLNLGWDDMEGDNCRIADCSDFHAPVATYPNPGSASITGGYVYRGSDFPAINGWYFYGDWSSGRVYKLVMSGGEASQQGEITSDLDPGGDIDGLASFGQDASGEVYVVSLYGGTIHRIVVE